MLSKCLYHIRILVFVDMFLLHVLSFKAVEITTRLYEYFLKYDAVMIEINPLVEDSSGDCEYLLYF